MTMARASRGKFAPAARATGVVGASSSAGGVAARRAAAIAAKRRRSASASAASSADVAPAAGASARSPSLRPRQRRELGRDAAAVGGRTRIDDDAGARRRQREKAAARDGAEAHACPLVGARRLQHLHQHRFAFRERGKGALGRVFGARERPAARDRSRPAPPAAPASARRRGRRTTWPGSAPVASRQMRKAVSAAPSTSAAQTSPGDTRRRSVVVTARPAADAARGRSRGRRAKPRSRRAASPRHWGKSRRCRG